MAESLDRSDTGIQAVWRDGLEDLLTEAFVDGGSTKAQAILTAGGKIADTHITCRSCPSSEYAVYGHTERSAADRSITPARYAPPRPTHRG
jgi:hypothetical protein